MIFQYFSRQIYFLRTFQESPLNSSTFQACPNLVIAMCHKHYLFLFASLVPNSPDGMVIAREITLLQDRECLSEEELDRLDGEPPETNKIIISKYIVENFIIIQGIIRINKMSL